MVPHQTLVNTLTLLSQHTIPDGAVVECGVWRGGAIASIASVLGHNRSYWLCDSFEGLPPPREVDGAAALAWKENVDGPWYFDNCSAPIEVAKEAMALSGATDVHYIKGWYDTTLPELKVPGGIAVLRLDCDWYDSMIVCLQSLFPQVVAGGLILIDDYNTWEGCAKAVHAYLSENDRPEGIMQFNNDVTYIIRKRIDA